MTRQMEQDAEARWRKLTEKAGKALNGGLEGALSRAGYEFRGITIKWDGYEALAVIKVDAAGGSLVAFVGSSTMASVVEKAHREAVQGKLRFRPDQWAKKES